MDYKRQKFVVFGLSSSGMAVSEFLISKGAKTYLYEELESEKISQNIDYLLSKGAILIDKNDYKKASEIADVLVLSPGVPINHPLAVECKRLKKRIIGELELAFLNVSTPVIAVTGTNGKTTTCNFISDILTAGGIENLLVGNIGYPVSKNIEELSNKIAVCEVSSFQLETVSAFCPHIACILNIAPDHLDRHYTMENYVFLKKRLLKNLKESEYAVLNYDDETVRTFQADCRGKVIWFSKNQEVEGAYIIDGKLYYKKEYICELNSISLSAFHSEENLLCGVCVCFLLDVKKEVLLSVLNSFKGVKHRNELIATVNGINYYNDSKGTNTAAAISAAKSMKNGTVMILGGKDKGEDYNELFNQLKETQVKKVVLVGESRFKMLESAQVTGFESVTLTTRFDDAFKIASLLAEKGGNVLLSPATSSYDMFSSYEERGNYFCKLVEGLSLEKIN